MGGPVRRPDRGSADLGRALLNTLQVAAVGMVLATLLGLLLAVGRLSDHGAVRWLVGIYIEFFRAIPLLVVIFALYFLLPKYGIRCRAFQALTGGLVLYNSAVLAEIFRAGHPVDRQGPERGRATASACASRR